MPARTTVLDCPCASDVDAKFTVPNTVANAAQCVSLPIFPEIKQDEIDYTIEKCIAFCKK